MNLLAHALVAHATLPAAGGQSITGAVMADFFAGQRLEDYPSAIVRAIMQHRELDAFTDAHPVFRELCARLDAAGAPRLTAGILLDLFWDQVLGSDWERHGRPHCGLDLSGFCAAANRALLATETWHSPRFRHVMPWLVGENWLAAYATREGIAATLRGLASRVRSARELAGCERLLVELDSELRHGFAAFWPEVWRTFAPEG